VLAFAIHAHVADDDALTTLSSMIASCAGEARIDPTPTASACLAQPAAKVGRSERIWFASLCIVFGTTGSAS